MTNKIENFNLSFPCSLILENFFHRDGLDVKRFATMRRSDGIFKLRNLFWILHSGFLSSRNYQPLEKQCVGERHALKRQCPQINRRPGPLG